MRQSIGTTIAIHGVVTSALAGGVTFSCFEKSEPRAVCYSGRDRCYLFIPKQAHLTKQSASPFSTLALSRSDAAYPPRAAFSYLSLSIYLSASMSLYFRLPVSLSWPPYLSSRNAPRLHACLRFSFIKLIAPTKPKKHVVWGVTREYRVGKHENVDRLWQQMGVVEHRSDQTSILTTLTLDRGVPRDCLNHVIHMVYGKYVFFSEYTCEY